MRQGSLAVAAPAADEALAPLIAAGDDDAFDELYRRYSVPLARYAGRILRDPAAGEDVAQTALLNAYQALRRGSSPEHCRSWLYRIARNAALEVIERRGDVVPLLPDEGGRDDPLDAHAQRADLIAALRTLPERQRAVYVLRELKGLRVGEIGTQLGLETEQVEQAMFAARNRLAEHLEFGDRLDCASLRSLAEARLTRAQRRAVKSHLRSCAACRVEAPLRVGVLTVPAALFDVLRTGVAALFGGGSTVPIAAKAAAVVVAATAAGAAPVVADLARPSAKEPVPVSAPAFSFAQFAETSGPSDPFLISFAASAAPRSAAAPPPTRPVSVAHAAGRADVAPATAPEQPAEPAGPAAEPEPDAAPVDEAPAEWRPADEPADEPLRDPEPEPARELPFEEPTLENPTRERSAPLRDNSAVDSTAPSAEPADTGTTTRG